MENITTPQVINKPFCANGDKNTIPSAATGSQLASLEEGFPEITEKPIARGGIPPERKDFNGAMNLNSQFYFAFQNGWWPTFSADVSTAIGGYPLGAVLWWFPETGDYAGMAVPLKSLVANNTYNFNTNESYIGVYWKPLYKNPNALPIGTVFMHQSSNASDVPGGLPLFTGETISNADELYPEFYTWVNSHEELQISAVDYQTALTTYGECPKYVIDTVNKSIRLPLLKNYVKFANTTDGITQKSAGLPNITGYIDAYKGGFGGGGSAGGAFTIGPGGFAGNVANEGGSSTRFTLNASNSNSEYGNANTVTPAHTTLYPWVCAYNGAAPASVAQAAQFQAALTTKADTDFANITGDGKQAIVNNIMPHYENVVSVDGVTAGVYTQVAKDSFVVTWGSDPFLEDYYVYVSPDNGTTKYIVGRRYDDENAQTEATSFPFFVPKGWYFTNNAEAGYSARIYPLKGAQ